MKNKEEGISSEQYIEHEVQLRVLDLQFKSIDGKLSWILSLLIGGMLLPVFLHILKVV